MDFWITFGIVVAGMVAVVLMWWGLRAFLRDHTDTSDPEGLAGLIMILLVLALAISAVVTYGDQPVNPR